MRIKLGRMYPSREWYITQTGHGAAQNYKSIDCYGSNSDVDSYAPSNFGGTIKNVHSNLGGQSYFDFYLDGLNDVYIQYVHQKPLREGHFNPGEKLARCALSSAKHCHAAIRVKGTWYELRDFMSKDDVKIIQARHLSWKSFNYENWVGWTDRYLEINPQSSNNDSMGQKINSYQFRLAKGGWVSQVITEVITAGVWSGTWQANEEKFRALNPTTPAGGFKPGDTIFIAPQPEPIHSPTLDNLQSQINQLQANLAASQAEKIAMEAAAQNEKKLILEKLVEERNAAAEQKVKSLEEMQKILVETDLELSKKDAQIEELASQLNLDLPGNWDKLVGDLAVEELEAQGVFEKLSKRWFDITEKIKSRSLRELIRYDLLAFVGINMAGIIAYVSGSIPKEYASLLPVVVFFGTLFKREVTKRMDRNKDGILDEQDYYVLQSYVDPMIVVQTKGQSTQILKVVE